MTEEVQKYVVVGNGFDLNLGIKSSYGDFVEYIKSREGFKNDAELSEYNRLFQKRERFGTANWSGFESELEKRTFELQTWNSSTSDSMNPYVQMAELNAAITQLEQEFYMYLSEQLLEWQEKYPEPYVTHEYKKIFDGSVVINFNYTDSPNILGLVDVNYCYSVHGSLKNNDIIFGGGFVGHEKSRTVWVPESFKNDKLVRVKQNAYLAEERAKLIDNINHSKKFDLYILGHSLVGTDLLFLETLLVGARRIYLYYHQEDYLPKIEELIKKYDRDMIEKIILVPFTKIISDKEGDLMKTNNNIPAYRFQGYTDAWKQRKLGEVGYAKSGVGFPEKEQGGKKGIPFFKVSDMNTDGNENELIVANNYVTDEQISRRKWRVITEVPAIFFAKVGAAVMLNRKRLIKHPFLLDNNTMTYIFNHSQWDSGFGKILFEKIDLTKLTQVGALPSYNSSDVEDIKISLPTLPEQKAIGTFFSTLDRQITLHQRKLDTLKEQKKTYLKLLFPAKGQTKPALRFQGFEDDWEEVKLRKILKERNEQIAENEEYPLMSFVQGVGVTPKGERYDRSFLVKEDNKKYKKTELGDFIYSSNNLETGSIGFNKTGKAVISPVYSIFYSKDEFESSFIGILSQRKDFIAKMIKFRQGVVYGQWRIHENDFLQILLRIPTKAEMEKIIIFFQTLDQEIAQVENKLASLKEMKKTLLRKLFV